MKKIKVLVLGQLVEKLKERLSRIADIECLDREEPLAEDVLARHLEDKEAVISEPLDTISSAIMDSSADLKIIANRAVGFDNVQIPDATKHGIIVTNTPGVLDAATADLAMALLLATARRVCEADRYVRNGNWSGFKSDLMLGPDLYGKTIGIIGMGRIGKAFARRARAFGLNLIYSRTSPADETDKQLGDELGAVRVEFDELLKTSDFISVHCPLNPRTRGLIGKRELELMKPDCILINTARGAIIDEQALVSHLVQGKIRGAGLDVFSDEPNVPKELLPLDNVVLLPHIGSACFETRFRMSELAVESVLSAFSGKRPDHLVNPEAWDEKKWQEVARANAVVG
jgi:glyoxylate reductase